MEGVYREKFGARELLAKEKKDLFFRLGQLLLLGKGMTRSYHAEGIFFCRWGVEGDGEDPCDRRLHWS